HGTQYPRRHHGFSIFRTWRLVRTRRLCRRSKPALLVSRSVVLPAILAIAFVVLFASLSGALVLPPRGVYFSLLALALTALLFTVGYRWTELTGGESGLGGVTRSTVLGVDLEHDGNYYCVVAAVTMAICVLLWRFHRSPVGSVLIAIRENEQRARFI